MPNLHQGEVLVAQLPSPDRAALVEELKRSPSPIAHALRVRVHHEEGEHRQRDTGSIETKEGAGDSHLKSAVGTDAVAKEARVDGCRSIADSRLEERPDYLYLEHVLAKLAASIHDPNWQVQRAGVAQFRLDVACANHCNSFLREDNPHERRPGVI